MKKYSFFILLLYAINACGQVPLNSPTIEQLLTWVDDSPGNFDKYATSLGFKFEKKVSPNDGENDYVYGQKIERNAVYFNDKIIFKTLGYGKRQSIQYITLQTDLINYFTSKLKANGFKSSDCVTPDADNQISLCYATASYTATLRNTMIASEPQETKQSEIEIIQNK